MGSFLLGEHTEVTMGDMQLAKLMPVDRREQQRRQAAPRHTISTHKAFDSEERLIFKELERRKELRRDKDVRRIVAKI
ncbi:MAG: hypothetical protein JRH20_02385 [Deltaproteobacteria bacterium]|nr:hypothetical protein [Deltaproteobacteria bacterium]